MTARISIPEPLPVPAWSDSEVDSISAISSPTESPLSPWSSFTPQIPFSITPLLIGRFLGRDPERYVGYGITDSWDEIVETLQGAPVSTDTELGAHMREFESLVRRDTDEIYTSSWRPRIRHVPEGLGRAWMRIDLAHGGVSILTDHSYAQMGGDQQSYSQVDRNTTEEMVPLTGNGVSFPPAGAGGRRLYWDRISWNCKPLVFQGHRGRVELTQWFDRMETVSPLNKLMLAENSDQIVPVLLLAEEMTDKFCPRNGMKMLEAELWNLKERQAVNKRKSKTLPKQSNHNSSQTRVAEHRRGENTAYGVSVIRNHMGDLDPLWLICNTTLTGPCAPKCYKLLQYGHSLVTVRGTGNVNINNKPEGHRIGSENDNCLSVERRGILKRNVQD
ncbi:hypothetical protein Tco_1194783 [Tanacetum coccineum]